MSESSGSHYVSLDTDAMVEPRTIGCWARTDCHDCGYEFELTRTRVKVVEPGEVLRCASCAGYAQAVKHLEGSVISHTKIFKRDDGSSVKIRVKFVPEHHQYPWHWGVYTKAKYKRTWLPVADSDRGFFGGAKSTKEKMKHVSVSEVHATMKELHASLAPSIAGVIND